MCAKLTTLNDVIQFITDFHPFINSGKGLYCLKLWRKPDGTRFPIEETKGVRIKNFFIFEDNTLVADLVSHATSYRGNVLHVFESRLYFPGLVMVNIYDYSAEFWTKSCIDFSYSQLTTQAKSSIHSAWIHGSQRELRAQWFNDPDDIEKVLSEVGLGPRFIPQQIDRNLDLDLP